MKLDYRFLQLPLQFDANRLLQEVNALGESAWKPHPQGFAGNFAMTLITPNGVNDNDEMAGPMQPTDYLKSCPYLMDVLRCMGGVWGRTRLMKLSGQAEVTAHIDVEYYWRERMRVHVPIITQPSVRFFCGDQNINMKAGECWIFDTWSMHNVINDATEARIHLVADTVGSETFGGWLRNGQPYGRSIPGWHTQSFNTFGSDLPPLRLESQNMPDVMTPWEMREHFNFLFSETVPHADLKHAVAIAFSFIKAWHALWTECGSDKAAIPRYEQLRDAFLSAMNTYHHLELRNDAWLNIAMMTIITKHCVRSPSARFAEVREAGRKALTITSSKIDRPVILLSSPRSGSTMFYEALEKCPNLASTGGESHILFETISALNPKSRNYDSNVLGAKDCTQDIAHELYSRFYRSAVLADGSKPVKDASVRLLEKTPKNALRIPFMKQLFPDAHFVYLYRNPKHVVSSMIDAWQSGQFITYPDLPGWTGLPWSLLLIPGWRGLIGKPLHHVVAHQWSITTKIMLDDLENLDPTSVHKIRYETLITNPQDELDRICNSCWVNKIPNLTDFPLSQYTLTPPDSEKWKRNELLIEEIWPIIEVQALRAAAYMQDTP